MVAHDPPSPSHTPHSSSTFDGQHMPPASSTPLQHAPSASMVTPTPSQMPQTSTAPAPAKQHSPKPSSAGRQDGAGATVSRSHHSGSGGCAQHSPREVSTASSRAPAQHSPPAPTTPDAHARGAAHSGGRKPSSHSQRSTPGSAAHMPRPLKQPYVAQTEHAYGVPSHVRSPGGRRPWTSHTSGGRGAPVTAFSQRTGRCCIPTQSLEQTPHSPARHTAASSMQGCGLHASSSIGGSGAAIGANGTSASPPDPPAPSSR
mmetsp:Transcript_19722/g.61207  ORF Transcript_19722/g.61207 Transcript_19722/m.61207 type:complete len:259 (-) Transcript_19722:589-1365(-)